MGKDEVGHQLEVRSHLGNDAQEHHAFDASERVVAHHDKAALLGDAGQLIRIHVDGDIHILEQVIGKFSALVVGGTVEQSVDLAQSTKAIRQSRHTVAPDTLHPEGVLEVCFSYDLPCRFFHSTTILV